MTGAEGPPTANDEADATAGAARGRLTSLPEEVRRLAALLSLCPVVSEPFYRLVARGFGRGGDPVWPFFSSQIVNAGVVEPAGDGDNTYRFGEACTPALRIELGRLGSTELVRRRLLDAWLESPDRAILATVTEWAGDSNRWDVFESAWMLLGEQTDGVPTRTLERFRDLPERARHERPILTWASGAAAALLTRSEREGAEQLWNRLLSDAMVLHADWAQREDTDSAVSAGTFRMIGERRLPSPRAGDSLGAAWRTKQEVDALIDARSRAGRAPTRAPHAIFRAFSARLALFRFDTTAAVEEAQWARILSDWEPVQALAGGVDALAKSLSSHNSEGERPPATDSIAEGLGPCGLRGIGAIYRILAAGLLAIRRLDRTGVERALALVRPTQAGIAGVWAARTALGALHDALWDDPEYGVRRLFAQLARGFGPEQREPLGGFLIARARTVLLTSAGALASAGEVVQTMPPEARVLPQIRIELYAGRYERAAEMSDSAAFAPDHTQLYGVSLLRVSARLLAGRPSQALLPAVVRDVEELVTNQTFIAFALMPRPARQALIEFCRPSLAGSPGFDVLLERLNALNDVAHVRPVRLTERERLLLPLLASSDSVPLIASQLHVSVNTVRKQVATLREKFGADSREELVRRARNFGALS